MHECQTCHCGEHWQLCWATSEEEILNYTPQCHICTCGGSELYQCPLYKELLEKQIPHFRCNNTKFHDGKPFILCFKSFWDQMYAPCHF